MPYSKNAVLQMASRVAAGTSTRTHQQRKGFNSGLRAGAANAKMPTGEIETRLAPTSLKTSGIYIKEAIPAVSDIDFSLHGPQSKTALILEDI